MRPRLLDLYCGAGGAAVGYHRAGFDVVGVDARAAQEYIDIPTDDDTLAIGENYTKIALALEDLNREPA
jgi:2-polyprenyl-3-methyl-5-hydroxy-6-metoxy-1,4-benzoquinol methylase